MRKHPRHGEQKMTSELNNDSTNSILDSIPLDSFGYINPYSSLSIKSYDYHQCERLLSALTNCGESSQRAQDAIDRVHIRMCQLAEKFVRRVLRNHPEVDAMDISVHTLGYFQFYRKPIRHQGDPSLRGKYVYGESVTLHPKRPNYRGDQGKRITLVVHPGDEE